MRFLRITKDNWSDAIRLMPKRNQYCHVRKEAVLYSMAKAFVSKQGEYTPLVIEEDGKLVGAIRVRNYGHGIGLAAFFIDRRYQRQGLGRKAVRNLVQWVRENYPKAVEIETAVDPDNAAARALYESEGFSYTGVVSATGVLDMEMSLKPPCNR